MNFSTREVWNKRVDGTGTEVDDEEYFQTIDGNTTLMLLSKEDIWSTEGPPYT